MGEEEDMEGIVLALLFFIDPWITKKEGTIVTKKGAEGSGVPRFGGGGIAMREPKVPNPSARWGVTS